MKQTKENNKLLKKSKRVKRLPKYNGAFNDDDLGDVMIIHRAEDLKRKFNIDFDAEKKQRKLMFRLKSFLIKAKSFVLQE